MNGLFTGIFMYADDNTLLAPLDYGLNHEKTDFGIIFLKLGFCVLFCRYIYKKQF